MKPLRQQRPSQQLAFLPYPDVEPLAECLAAFANSSGGLIVLGLDDEGVLVEEVLAEDAESGLHGAMSMCQPPVVGQWQRLPTGVSGLFLIGIRVERSDEIHSLADGRILVRSGTENRPLSGEEVAQLATGRTLGDFEEEIVAGATQADFDEELIQEYLLKREKRGTAVTSTRQRFLLEIGAITPNGQPTVAGLLLFGQNPQAFMPQTGVVFVRFPSTEPRSATGEAGYGRRDELRGPLPRVVERLWNIIWEEMRVGAVINQLVREEQTEYPTFAVREAVVNAVCHRDYRIKGRRIEVRMYSDRMEIISPGGLPGYMTLDNLVEEHYSRNPRLVNGLYQWGYIEELGLGIDRMIEEMVQFGHPPPQFKATNYSFTVILSNNQTGKPAPPAWTNSMNERQARALAYVREHGSITNREYQRLSGDVSAETLRRDLSDLVLRGALLKIGSKKGTYYILK
jgi:ATP-dependent DNA helicase RecG